MPLDGVVVNLQRRIEFEVRILVQEARGEDAGPAQREHDQLRAALDVHIAQARSINEKLTGIPRLIAEGVSHLSARLDHTEDLQARLDLVYAPTAPPLRSPASTAPPSAPSEPPHPKGVPSKVAPSPAAPARRERRPRRHGATPHVEATLSWEARGMRTAASIRKGGVAKDLQRDAQIEVCMKVALQDLGRAPAELPRADAEALRRGVIRGLDGEQP